MPRQCQHKVSHISHVEQSSQNKKGNIKDVNAQKLIVLNFIVNVLPEALHVTKTVSVYVVEISHRINKKFIWLKE